MSAKSGMIRTAVVTGASSGIGQATALAFAEAGWALVLAARGEADLERVADECRGAGARVLAVPTDVTEATAVAALAEAALSFTGQIDLWFANVGVGVVGKFLEVPIETHQQVIAANLIGHMNEAYAALPIFLRQKRGTFVNMISVGGFSAAPYATSYSASKFGLRGFSEALRAEVAGHRHVHVCDVYPSFVDTPAIGHAGNYTGAKLSAPPPLLDARRVATAVVRLADHPRASTLIGAPTWAARLTHTFAPNLNARAIGALFDSYFARAEPAHNTNGNVLTPPGDGARIDGGLRSPAPVRALRFAAAAAVGLLAIGAGGLAVARQRASS
ncbi:MAG: SDR family oxidoreductase [Pseudomonas sp.]|uniref:SDR family oxidoreductase n=1 Tax=Pseudomonas sp. TaxID=306 RepID=UPI001217E6EB|nr:SDR family oxidoreductase [Pseudomonas sp.]RZI76710.1 MAG: SDR family oxidoreductase [Pseudomonas sp.]